MIQVCDAIMGTGKSSAAITYMNERPNDKFIYITPYLSEAARIKAGCPEMNFIEPSEKLRQFHFKKSEHTAYLIKNGSNIATTHQAFKMYTDDMLEDIRRNKYRLIIDENVDVLEKYVCSPDDIQIAVDAGYIREENGMYHLTEKEYGGAIFRDLFRFLKNHDLICLDEKSGNDSGCLFYYILPPELICSFQDVFILTYLFKGQGLHHFLKIYDLPYKYIGIHKDENGTFRFGDYPGYTPEYVSHIGDMIHILDNEKLNRVGNDIHALSMRWYETKDGEVDRLKKNIYNCFNNIWRGTSPKDKLWGCFKSYEHRVTGSGYTKSFLTFNARATNEYRNRRYLVYVVNIFMNVCDKIFYQSQGVEVDEDAYALSVMLQWIWRSSIRDGDEIYLYIPSKRMRTLLTNWIQTVSKGGNTIEA